jgi:hypothetical protein
LFAANPLLFDVLPRPARVFASSLGFSDRNITGPLGPRRSVLRFAPGLGRSLAVARSSHSPVPAQRFGICFEP